MKNLHTYLDEVSRVVDPSYKNFLYACREADPDILNKIVEEATRRYMDAMNAEPDKRFFIVFYNLRMGYGSSTHFVPYDYPIVSDSGKFPNWFKVAQKLGARHEEPTGNFYFTNILEVSEEDYLNWREPQ